MPAVDAETVDYVAIRRLQDAYADITTRRAWGELAEIFLPDVRLTLDRRTLEPLVLDGPTAIGEFIGTAIAGLDFFEFVVLNSVVQLRHRGDDDRAVARLYMNELRHDGASGQWTTVYGVYHDVHRRVDGRWWFAERRYHTLARTGRAVDTFGFPAGDLW
jgi:hypothetical protein